MGSLSTPGLRSRSDGTGVVRRCSTALPRGWGSHRFGWSSPGSGSPSANKWHATCRAAPPEPPSPSVPMPQSCCGWAMGSPPRVVVMGEASGPRRHTPGALCTPVHHTVARKTPPRPAAPAERHARGNPTLCGRMVWSHMCLTMLRVGRTCRCFGCSRREEADGDHPAFTHRARDTTTHRLLSQAHPFKIVP